MVAHPAGGRAVGVSNHSAPTRPHACRLAPARFAGLVRGGTHGSPTGPLLHRAGHVATALQGHASHPATRPYRPARGTVASRPASHGVRKEARWAHARWVSRFSWSVWHSDARAAAGRGRRAMPIVATALRHRPGRSGDAIRPSRRRSRRPVSASCSRVRLQSRQRAWAALLAGTTATVARHSQRCPARVRPAAMRWSTSERRPAGTLRTRRIAARLGLCRHRRPACTGNYVVELAPGRFRWAGGVSYIGDGRMRR